MYLGVVDVIIKQLNIFARFFPKIVLCMHDGSSGSLLTSYFFLLPLQELKAPGSQSMSRE